MANIKREVLRVEGMTCSSCELRIEKAINKLEGVKEIKAVYSSSKVYVTFDESVIEIYEIIKEIEKAGYKPSLGIISLPVIKEVNIMKSLKKMINDFLKKLTDQNQEQFGNEKLDCCKLDRPKQNNK